MLDKKTSAVIRWMAIWLLVWMGLALPANALSGNKGGCMPAFPLDPSWQGADAAYSIPLPDGRDIWIFGDTLYGEKRGLLPNGDPLMVRNSIGISTCTNMAKRNLPTWSATTRTELQRIFLPRSIPIPGIGPWMDSFMTRACG